MKIFIFTLILFLCLLGFIIFNYIYVNRASRELMSKATEISLNADEVKKLRSAWESKKSFIVLSSGMTKIDRIYDLLDSLEIYAEHGDAVEFENTRALMINAFDDLSEFESFYLEDIF